MAQPLQMEIARRTRGKPFWGDISILGVQGSSGLSHGQPDPAIVTGGWT